MRQGSFLLLIGLLTGLLACSDVETPEGGGLLSLVLDRENPTVAVAAIPTCDLATGTVTVVSGTITVTADAADNVGVVRVFFRVDGTSLGPSDAEAPFEMPLDTTDLADGQHLLEVSAQDFAGNTETSEVFFIVHNNPRVTILAQGLVGPWALAMDTDHLYWTEFGFAPPGGSGSVKKIPTGGGNVTTVASGLLDPVAIAVDGQNVYWAEFGPSPVEGSVAAVPKSGGSVTTLATGLFSPRALAVDATHLYWTEFGSLTDSATPGAVRKVPIGGGTIEALSTGLVGPWALAVDGANVYWTEVGASAGEGKVLQRVKDLSGGSLCVVGPNPPDGSCPAGAGLLDPVALLTGGGDIFFTEFGTLGLKNGALRKVPVGGGVAESLATALPNPQTLAVSTNFVFWAELGGKVKRVPRSGGTPETLVSGLIAPGTLLSEPDESALYVTEFGTTTCGGFIKKITP